MMQHPNPQFARPAFLLLDGEWEFQIDNAATYWKRPLEQKPSLKGSIRVPFCPESKLSGVENKDFNLRLWYAKEFDLPQDFAGKRILLRFGASDYHTTVFVNGVQVGEHFGGYSPFFFDVTPHILPKNRITVCVFDDTRDTRIPSGKQSPLYHSFSALYTRTSGIWQSVWLEAYEEIRIDSLRFTTRADGEITCALAFDKSAVGCTVELDISFAGEPVVRISDPVTAFDFQKTFRITDPVLWSAGVGNLYDCRLTLCKNGRVFDTVCTYFGIREVGFCQNSFTLNGKPLFLRTVLDQGFYRDGVYTAPDDKALENDIRIAMDMGFNGARLHEKVFDPRYLYHADRLGFLVFGEYPDMGLSTDKIEALAYMLPEWLEVMKRDINHPSIVAWYPFNETSTNDFFSTDFQNNRVLETVYHITKQFDPSRPVFDTSGSMHTSVTDIYDIHDYTQDTEKFKELFAKGIRPHMYGNDNGTYRGQPYMITEFGGIRWEIDGDGSNAWGYGAAPATEQEFLTRFEGMVSTLLGNPDCTGFCYTQLYDVEQEKNGLYTFDRVAKFDPAYIKAIVSAKAAVET
ncbi:MAG: beta-galactosidase [Clostridia bacterium]|nr:beta-galactosidase [Clostridia bacterium]